MRNSITIILTLGILVVAPAVAHSNVTEQAAPTASQDHANNTSDHVRHEGRFPFVALLEASTPCPKAGRIQRIVAC